MAKLISGLSFTGSLSNLSAYKMRGHDGIIVRTKGGPSKEKIKESPSFLVTGCNNMEFGDHSTAASWTMFGTHP